MASPSAGGSAGLSAADLASELAGAAGGVVRAILLYGSHLHGAGGCGDSALDLIVVVDDYGSFFRALQSSGHSSRSPRVLSLASRILPPTAISFLQGAAKCQIVSLRDFRAALGPRRRDHMLLGRIVQRLEILYARDARAAAEIEEALAAAHADVLTWLAPFLDEPFDADDAALAMVTLCYRHELRPEARDRASVVFAHQRDLLTTRMAATLATAEHAGLLVRDGAEYRFARAIPTLRRLRLRAYFAWSNARGVARWPKYAITFEAWLPYLVRKVERRTGQPVRLTVLERRWPLIFLWPRVVRTLRHRPAKERGV